jgi:hypothetical protein
MIKQSFRHAAATTTAALLLTASFVGAQSNEPELRISRPAAGARQAGKAAPRREIDREVASARAGGNESRELQMKKPARARARSSASSAFARTVTAAAAPSAESFGTGGGDLSEIEPNDRTAQGVGLPVNVFGTIAFNLDVDFFAFQALAGEQVTIEPFAARLRNSELIADIALFDEAGNLLASNVGDENNDPVIRFRTARDQVLIVGITDADDFGGASFDYILNITRGVDADEAEPNDRTAQRLPEVPVTVFGEISRRDDVDFYSFTASAGQTLIVDVDAESLGSRLDAEINLLDPETGVEYFYNDQHDNDDPRFNIVLPYTGRYIIGVGAFESDSTGFYRLNASVVTSAGAPIITRVTRVSKKLVEVGGTGLTSGSRVEINGIARKTTFVASGTLRAKGKARVGDVITVSNPPDDRRSNPLVVQ